METKIFHITDWEHYRAFEAGGDLKAASLEDEGFIHCSTRAQLIGVANRRYKGRTDICVVEIDVSRVKAKIVYENLEGGDVQYPHIYGVIDRESIVATHQLKAGSNGEWESI